MVLHFVQMAADLEHYDHPPCINRATLFALTASPISSIFETKFTRCDIDEFIHFYVIA